MIAFSGEKLWILSRFWEYTIFPHRMDGSAVFGHGIAYLQVNGEAASMNPAGAEKWVTLLPIIFNTYDPRVVYNVNELCLFLRVQTSQSLSMKGEFHHDGKINKNRIMVLLCCNEDEAVGDPWVVGSPTDEAVGDRKGEEPDVLVAHIVRLPCVYKHNAKTWITCDIFEQLLRTTGVQRATICFVRGQLHSSYEITSCSSHQTQASCNLWMQVL